MKTTMIRTNLILLIGSILISANTFAQSTHPLVNIGDHHYSIEEFNFIYNKNNSFSHKPISPKEYLDLFVNYKLKVLEACDQGLDTLPSFTKEFNYYKDELAKPYLTDKNITDQLVKEAYQRLKTEVNASHILVKLPPSPSPEDTLKAYQKISSIVKKYKAGEDFNQLARQYSEDPSAYQNEGKLGYFNGFMMVYPFESAAYNTAVGEISPIVRTAFGYHIIKVHDKRANRGELRTAHIMQIFPSNAPQNVIAEKKAKIDSIYQLLQKGADFGTLARQFSEDKNSANNNGELPWFGTGRMIPEFSEPAFQLDSIGSISKVIQSPYGFHIIKLLEKRGLQPFEKEEEKIRQKIAKDERAYQGKKAVINRLKKEYNYQQNDALLRQIKQKASNQQLSNDDFFYEFENSNNNIASMKGWTFKASDLIEKLKENKQFTQSQRNRLFDKLSQSIIEDEIISFEKSRLEDKYPAYRYLVNEYHDGLLIFEISQREIWNKAIRDSTGIEAYYAAHKSNYFHPETMKGILLLTNDKKIWKAAKKSMASHSISADSLKQLYPHAKIIEGSFAKGEYKALDKQLWNEKKSTGKVDPHYKYLWGAGKKTARIPKELEETRGQVIADYQNQIEKEWLSRLRNKFAPTVNKKALKFSKKAAKK